MSHDAIERMLPLPNLSYLVLLALAEGEAHGWAIIKRIRALTAEQTDPSSGSVYLAIVRLGEAGLLEEAAGPAGEDARRRYYRVTRFGRDVLDAETARMDRLVRRARELGAADARPLYGDA